MRIDLSGLEGEELEAGRLLNSNASTLRSYSDEYNAALALFREGPQLHRDYGQIWFWLAPKIAIVSVYNFSMALKGVRTEARRIRRFADEVGNIEKARETLKTAFPDLAELRQTVLHGGEKHWNAERDRENTAPGPVRVGGFFAEGPAAVSSCIDNETYVASFAGRTVRFEMSNQKAWDLIHVIEALEAIFTKLRENAVGNGK